MRVAIILGTRPEIIKMSSIISYCAKKKIPYYILHTGQHYNYEMDKIFLKELGLNSKKITNLGIGSGTHGEVTGKMLIKIEKNFIDQKPDIVLVQGDTNTVLAGTLAAVKLQIPVGHVEAGLRSYDKRMPEEHNRIVADHLSDYLFAPTKDSEKILKKENIDPKNIYITGNTVADAVKNYSKISGSKSKILKKLKLNKNGYILATVHRQENVDDLKTLKNILKGMTLVSDYLDLPILYPAHPRTEAKIKKNNIKIPKNLIMIKPVGFFDFLNLQKNSALIITDSGGVQEEACILKKRCVTVRENTERPETIMAGGNILAGSDPQRILKTAKKIINKKINWKMPFGDGKSGEKIIKIVLKNE